MFSDEDRDDFESMYEAELFYSDTEDSIVKTGTW